MASIRAGKPLNAAKDVAETTLTGIMGREAAYSGQTIEWDEALNSKTRLGPEKYVLGSVALPGSADAGRAQVCLALKSAPNRQRRIAIQSVRTANPINTPARHRRQRRKRSPGQLFVAFVSFCEHPA